METETKILKIGNNTIKVVFSSALSENGEKCGTVESNMKEICKYCHDPACNMTCFDARSDFANKNEVELLAHDLNVWRFQIYNAMIDAIESMILAHACAGLDVESEPYVRGIETALDAIENQL